MYIDFVEKRAVSLSFKSEMKSFIVESSTQKASGKEVQYLPNEDALVKEVEENLGEILVLWDVRQLQHWKLKDKIIVDLRDFYEAKVRPLSLRLNDVAVDEGFIPREELVEEYENEYLVNLISHTSDHASWIAKLDRKYFFTDSLYSLMRLVDAPNIDYVMHGSILPIELLLTKIAKERGETLPKIKDITKEGGWYEGGFVLEPSVGLFSNVAIMDFSKYYPSLMMDFNLSPEITKIVDSKPLLDFRKRGLIPEALEYLTKTRNELEEKLGKIKPGDQDWFRLNSDREAVKVTQNAMYGALASDQFPSKSRDLASFIASLGREGLRETISECEKKGFKVLYADTDSVMAQVPFEKVEALAKYLTHHLQEYFKEKYDLPISKWELRLKFSKFAKTIIFHGKKNYALWDGKTIEIIGLFRQARSHFSLRFQEEFYGMILKGTPLKDVERFVDKQLVEFRKAPIEEVALCTKINQRINQYKVASWHIKGAKNAQDLLGIKFEAEDTIKLLWLKGKPDIIGFEYEGQIAEFKDRIDWKRMEESLISLAKPGLEILNKEKAAKQETLF
jgi:DNA polymerase elongation subunit (family B)